MDQTIAITKTVLIVGGGFAGVKTALELASKHLENTRIILISNKPHFEYHATLYRVLTGKSPLQVCIPLRDIFADTNVEVLEDLITNIDTARKKATGASGSTFNYDSLVLAIGGEPAYYDTVGLKELSFSIDSIKSVLKLKNHLHTLFSEQSGKEHPDNLNIVIVGGGVTGCEIAAELSFYTKTLAKQHKIDYSFVSIDLIHSGSRLVPILSDHISEKVLKRLQSLGINIFLNQKVLKEDIEEVYMKDMTLKTKTLLWTAGIVINKFYKNMREIELNERGKVVVDEYLQVKGFDDFFVIGDAAALADSGMAQSALNHGEFVANVIYKKIFGIKLKAYAPIKSNYAVPLGGRYAISVWGGRTYYGLSGWVLRKYADFKFFTSILPFSTAITAFRSEGKIWESCELCCPRGQKY